MLRLANPFYGAFVVISKKRGKKFSLRDDINSKTLLIRSSVMASSETGKVAVRRWAGFGTFIFVTSGISLGIFLASISG